MKMMATALAGLLAAGAASAAMTGPYKVVKTVPGPDGGWDYVRLDAANHRVVMTRGTSVMTLDLPSLKITADLAPGQRLHDALPVNGGRELLVSNGGTDSVVFVDGKSGAALATIKVGKNPDAEALDPATGLALVMNHGSGDVTFVDPKTRAAVGTLMVGGDLEAAAVDGQGHAFVNVENKNETVLVDVKAKTVIRHIPLPGCDGPTGATYEPKRHWVIAACDGSTAIIDARSGKPVKTLKSGKEADGVAVDEKRDLAFVPGRDGSLTVISLKGAPKVVQTLKTAVNNRTLAVDEATGRVYLPVAELKAGAPGERPTPVAGTFRVLVVGP